MLGIIITYVNLFPITFSRQLSGWTTLLKWDAVPYIPLCFAHSVSAGWDPLLCIIHSFRYKYKAHLLFLQGPAYPYLHEVFHKCQQIFTNVSLYKKKFFFDHRIVSYEKCSREFKTLALSLNSQSATYWVISQVYNSWGWLGGFKWLKLWKTLE